MPFVTPGHYAAFVPYPPPCIAVLAEDATVPTPEPKEQPIGEFLNPL